jgi:hypothetical protein
LLKKPAVAAGFFMGEAKAESKDLSLRQLLQVYA